MVSSNSNSTRLPSCFKEPGHATKKIFLFFRPLMIDIFLWFVIPDTRYNTTLGFNNPVASRPLQEVFLVPFSANEWDRKVAYAATYIN